MSNLYTVQAITKNIETVLKGKGINFTQKAFDDETQIPASLLPLGQIFYNAEEFEYVHGQRPGYAEIAFTVKVVIDRRTPEDSIRDQQSWVHSVRDGLTVNALNIGDIVTSKLVSKVTTESVSIENKSSNISALTMAFKVRYREE